MQKLFLPGDYNASSILKSLPRQNTARVICEPEFYSMELPPSMAADYTDRCAAVSEVVVPTTETSLGKSQLFPNAKVTTVDPYSL